MNIIIDLENYSRQASVFKRAAARAIIADGDQYLLIFSKYGDCKFPVKWMTLSEAIEKNKRIDDLEVCPWVTRDTAVMERLVKEQSR